MNKTSLLIGSGITTLMGQIAFALDMNGMGIALSTAALPMLLPFALSSLKQRSPAIHTQLSFAN